MSGYGILRIEKIKSRSGLVGRTAHNLRSTPTPNADHTKTNLDLRPVSAQRYAIQQFDAGKEIAEAEV